MNENTSRSNQIISEEWFKKFLLLSQKRKTWLTRERESKAINELLSCCKGDDYFRLCYDLLNEFTFIESEEFDSITSCFVDQITEVWRLDPEQTLFLPIRNKSNSIPNSSERMLSYIAPKITIKENWEKAEFKTLGNFVHLKTNIKNVVIIDDFCGTGGSLVQTKKLIKERLIKSRSSHDYEALNFYFLYIASMQACKSLIEENSTESYIYKWLKKGITDYYPPESVNTYLEIMYELEGQLKEKYKNNVLKHYSLGYEQSETLFGIDRDRASNNVFPIFWWPFSKNGIRETILPPR